jgi:succinate dehydrogenase/fumarate reductase flavoprotein subunit
VVDFLVVGGGVAGLRAAIGLAPAGRVLILTKAEPAESNTGYAQGGIAAAVGDDDTPALHARDTIRAGDGLCDEAAVQVLVEQGPAYVRELLAWGARFDRDAGGHPELGREAAHSVRRVLHAGDATGREIGRVLWERARALPSIAAIDHALVTELVVEQGRVTGVVTVTPAGVSHEVRAAATLLATGGAGQVFRETTNPVVATGDGIALAYDAGARVADLEFIQFHPTALDVAGAPRFLISERCGEKARGWSTRAAMRSCPRTIRRAIWRRATSSHAASRARSSALAARSTSRSTISIRITSRNGFRRSPRPFVTSASISRAIRSRWARRRTTSWAVSRRTTGAAHRSRDYWRPVRWRARAFTAPTGWRATRCSRGWCLARVRRSPCRSHCERLR